MGVKQMEAKLWINKIFIWVWVSILPVGLQVLSLWVLFSKASYVGVTLLF